MSDAPKVEPIGNMNDLSEKTPVERPRGKLHRLKPGAYDPPPQEEPRPFDVEVDDDVPVAIGVTAAELFVCEGGDLAWDAAFEELPPKDMRAKMPPHDLCAICWPDEPSA